MLLILVVVCVGCGCRRWASFWISMWDHEDDFGFVVELELGLVAVGGSIPHSDCEEYC